MQIDGATEEHAGSYLCSISNVLEERWTEAVEVNVGACDRFYRLLKSTNEIVKSGAKKVKKKKPKNLFPL